MEQKNYYIGKAYLRNKLLKMALDDPSVERARPVPVFRIKGLNHHHLCLCRHHGLYHRHGLCHDHGRHHHGLLIR